MESILKEILSELQAQKVTALGFCDPPMTRTIYANRQYPDCLWYFWNGGTARHEPIEKNAITGVIEKVSIEAKEFRGKSDPKLNVLLRADKPYIIQFGLEVEAAKGLMWTLVNLSDAELKAPLTIAVEPGNTDKVLFLKLYKGSQALYFEREKSINWKSIANKVCDRFASLEPSTLALLNLKLSIADCASEVEFADCMASIEAVDLQGTEKAQAIAAWQSHKAAVLPPTEVARINSEIVGAVKILKWTGVEVQNFIGSLFPGKSARKDLSFAELQTLANQLIQKSGAKK